MFKIVDFSQERLIAMGFKKTDFDWFLKANIGGDKRVLFTVYAGSEYLRVSRTSYVAMEQLKLIHEWTKQGFIEYVNV